MWVEYYECSLLAVLCSRVLNEQNRCKSCPRRFFILILIQSIEILDILLINTRSRVSRSSLLQKQSHMGCKRCTEECMCITSICASCLFLSIAKSFLLFYACEYLIKNMKPCKNFCTTAMLLERNAFIFSSVHPSIFYRVYPTQGRMGHRAYSSALGISRKSRGP